MNPYAWAWDAEALLLVPLLTGAYAVAVWGRRPGTWRVAAFLTGQALILGVSISPLQTIALDYLLSAHLLQNVVLAEWAPALCVLGLPPALAERLARPRVMQAITHPYVALPLWLASYFFWHLPWAYEAALDHRLTLLHLEHGSYFVTGCLLWWPVFHGGRRMSSGGKAAYLVAAFALASPLGLLLALLPEPVYDAYADGPGLWGLSPLTDQQLAGVTMAAEQAVVFFCASALYFLRFLREQESPESELSSPRGLP